MLKSAIVACRTSQAQSTRTTKRSFLTNRHVMQPLVAIASRKCPLCPLPGNCLEENIVYRGKVTINDQEGEKNYIGCTAQTMKKRQYAHRDSFKYKNKKNGSRISQYIWELRNSGISMDNINIEWSVLDRATAYRNGTRKCNLCLTEKYHIITSPLDLINKRTEFISKCRHENKFYLMNYKEVPPESQSDQWRQFIWRQIPPQCS